MSRSKQNMYNYFAIELFWVTEQHMKIQNKKRRHEYRNRRQIITILDNMIIYLVCLENVT